MNENNESSLKNSNNITGEILRNMSAPLSVAVELYMKQSTKTTTEQPKQRKYPYVKDEDWPTL